MCIVLRSNLRVGTFGIDLAWEFGNLLGIDQNDLIYLHGSWLVHGSLVAWYCLESQCFNSNLLMNAHGYPNLIANDQNTCARLEFDRPSLFGDPFEH